MPADAKHKIHTLLGSNRVQEAEALCRKLSGKQPKDAEIWFLLGSVLGQQGKFDEAVICLKKSTTLQNNVAVTHQNLGLVYLHKNMLPEARDSFEKALKINPNFTAARLELANTIQSGNNPAVSIPHYEIVLQQQPGMLPALINLSSAHLSVGDTDKAIYRLKQALSVAPGNPDVHFRLAGIYLQQHEFENAAAHYRHTLASKPDMVEALANLGNCHLQLENPAMAADFYRQAIELRKNSAELHFNLGNALRANGNPAAAESEYNKAVQLKPDFSEAINNLGLVYFETGRYDQAATHYKKSIAVNPQNKDAYINLARCYRETRQSRRACELLAEALLLMPDAVELHWDYSLALLEMGRFSEGWKEYAWRLKNNTLITRDFPVEDWRGQPVNGKHILVTAEQGIGDEIMFASCIPDLIERADRVTIECEPRLAPIFQRSFPQAQVHPAKQTDDTGWFSKIEQPDFHISAGSLPAYLRNSKEDFPKHEGYLFCDENKLETWKSRFKKLEHPFSVGISWKGGHISMAKRRSTDLSEWGPILGIAGINFINIQYGDTTDDIKDAEQIFGITIHSWNETDPLQDMDGFAAQVSALDLVISVDNSTVHLAGALGVQTWVIQPFSPDWRWLGQSSSSYWYPALTQFHPEQQGDWKPLFMRLKDDLERLLQQARRTR